MSLPKYATPLCLDLKASRIFLVILCFMHGGAILVLLIVPVSGWLSILFILLIVLNLYLQINLYIRMNTKKSIVRLVWLEGQQWKIFDRCGDSVEGVLLGQSYLHAGLVVLRFKTAAKERRVAIIFIDSVTAESHRKLRVRLRMQVCS